MVIINKIIPAIWSKSSPTIIAIKPRQKPKYADSQLTEGSVCTGCIFVGIMTFISEFEISLF